MRPSFHVNRLLSLTTLLIILSILSFAYSAPLPPKDLDTGLLATRGSTITEEEYVAYLKKYFPETDRYLLFTGNSLDQLKAFQAKNPGYYGYEDFFNARKVKPFRDTFPGREDDGEASSRAVAVVATKQVLVFGGIEYQNFPNSMYTDVEDKALKEGMQDGRLKTINHMAKDATSPTQILAKEDAGGRFTYQPGYSPGTPNHSIHNCERAAGVPCGSGGPEKPNSGSTSDSGGLYGPPAQVTHTGDEATPRHPARPSGPPASDPVRPSRPPVVVEEPDIRI